MFNNQMVNFFIGFLLLPEIFFSKKQKQKNLQNTQKFPTTPPPQCWSIEKERDGKAAWIVLHS